MIQSSSFDDVIKSITNHIVAVANTEMIVKVPDPRKYSTIIVTIVKNAAIIEDFFMVSSFFTLNDLGIYFCEVNNGAHCGAGNHAPGPRSIRNIPCKF